MDLRLFGPRVRDENHKSPHWACHRHLSMVGLLLLLVCQNGTIYCQRSQGFFPCHKGIKGAFQNLLQAFQVYTLRGFISHHVGEPTKCWWATDTNVAGKAVGMQQTSWLWQNFSVAVQAEKQHTCNPFMFVRDYYWTTVERKEVFQFLPVCQWVIWTMKAGILTFGMWDINER